MTKTSISNVVPDENQPRKYFHPGKLEELTKSIRTQGIVNPLVVEEIGRNKYLLVDGERRYRAAVELGLTEVPIVVLESKDPVERRIEQFHVQEMHEGWSPTEKAAVIQEISDTLNIPFKEVCDRLGINMRTGQVYAAVTRMASPDAFSKSGLDMYFAPKINSVVKAAKKVVMDEYDEAFTLTDQKSLETKIIKDMKNGTVESGGDLLKMKDMFISSPETIDAYIKGADYDELFVKSNARERYHLRNAANSAMYLNHHIITFLANPNTKLDSATLGTLKQVKKSIETLINLAGKE